MELIKKQIHMNRWKGNAVTQITLDEDFIVPDTLEDMEQVILEQAHIQGENVKTQEEKITVKGKLEFQEETFLLKRLLMFRDWQKEIIQV